MPDIFISYSRKDSAHAIELAERLRADGMDVWIDQRGIVGAEKWATEIVEGIRACSTFIILLSSNSIESENVLRELSLASEKRKRVLPVDIEPTVLPSSFEYPLAGLQRVPFADFDRIVHAHKHGVEKVIHKDERKSLMILPFEDLSPAQDNDWLANGLVSELISALSNVKALRIADNQATKEFKKYNGQLVTYATEMNIRYFVQGDVRKFGDNIKITSRLLDIETGDHLWQDSMKGVMENIFDIQEAVALKVVEGLKVHLASDEKKKMAERGTENAEAYELYMKAIEYFNRQTKENRYLAMQLLTEAIRLDPAYANAYQFKATALAGVYRSYDRNPALLTEAELLCKEALRVNPDYAPAYGPLSMIYKDQGKLDEAEAAAKEYTRKAPGDSRSHFALGFFYAETGQPANAIAPYEEAVRLKPDHRGTLYNLVVTCHAAKEMEKCRLWALSAIPIEERHLRLHPDDEGSRMHYSIFLNMSGRTEDAHREALILKNARDAVTLYNTACLFGGLGDKLEALSTFRKSMEAGYGNIHLMKNFLTEEYVGVVQLVGTPEYEEVKRMVEKLEAEPGIRG